MEVAKENLTDLVQLSGKTSLSNAYNAAFVAYEIGITPFKAPFIGLKCMKYGETAVKQDSTNYFALIQYGNIMNYMPKAFGGSKDKALVYYKKAREIMRKDEVLYKEYRRHFSDTKKTVCDVLEKLVSDYPEDLFTINLTGSGAMSAATFLDLPFI
mgnify:CR=1 FL=1